MLTEGLLALMNSCTPLTNIVGNRIYPVVLPKNYTVPAITFYVVTNKTDVALDYTFASTDQIEINVWANNYHDASYGQQALHTLLDMYHGTLPDGTVVLFTSSHDNPDFFEKDSLLYRCSTTFSFLH
jgi:hypothetical protein